MIGWFKQHRNKFEKLSGFGRVAFLFCNKCSFGATNGLKFKPYYD